jgi:hypothetical protein
VLMENDRFQEASRFDSDSKGNIRASECLESRAH